MIKKRTENNGGNEKEGEVDEYIYFINFIR